MLISTFILIICVKKISSIFFKDYFKLVTAHSMPVSTLLVFQKRLNFIFTVINIIIILFYAYI